LTAGWRLSEHRDKRRVFDGEGGRLHGGRWNQPGTPLVYTAGSLALATLEILVNADRATLSRPFFKFKVEVPDHEIEQLAPARLPPNWKKYPAPDETKLMGSAWADSKRSLVLSVPSAITEERNYLLNPAHPNFGLLVIGAPELFWMDPRLVGPK
jgi:RES domain-containing protein